MTLNSKLPSASSPGRQPSQPAVTTESTVPRAETGSARKASSSAVFLNGEQWLEFETGIDEDQVVFGSPRQTIVRTETKNLIVAPEKAFKTTFALRLMLGSASGITVFPKLPVIRPRSTLYVHGELSPHEIQERTRAAAIDLPRPLVNFVQGRDLRIHLIKPEGQRALREIIATIRPDDLVLDPWQSFITGCNENEFQDVSRATHFMDWLIDEFKVTIYLVTHMGKDHGRGTRGHSSLAGWRDTLFTLERKGELVKVKIEPRWAAPVEPFNLEFSDGTVSSTEKSGFTRQADDIRKFLMAERGHATREQIGIFLKKNGDALRKALKRAQEANAIVIDGDQIRLPDADEPDAVKLLLQECYEAR